MTVLVIFKRFEIWLLLAVVISLLVFAFRAEPAPDPDKPTIGPLAASPSEHDPAVARSVPEPPDPAAPPFSIREVQVDRAAAGWIVETVFAGRSPGPGDLDLDSAAATTADGEPVPRFFEPFRPSALLPSNASEESVATLRWWLEKPAETLWIDVAGRSLRAELP